MRQTTHKRSVALARQPSRENAADRRNEAEPFWRKPLAELGRGEWEALCDGCGRCCLVKLEDEDTGQIHFTDVACKLFESGSCRCRDYARRRRKVSDCVKLTPENVETIPWLPPTCAYRLRREGKDLPDWHPLVSGDPETVHRAGVSARGRVSAFEDDVPVDELPRFIVAWPGKWPRGAKRPKGAKRPPPGRTKG
jgi:uncharacterized protein